MWWHDVQGIGQRLQALNPEGRTAIDPTASIDQGVVLDDSGGPIVVGARSRICAGALLRGPIQIGADCLIGNQSMLRGPVIIGDGVKVGFTTEIKQAVIADRVSIGPMCFVADSKIDDGAYLGALVRTSNHRLDGQPISVRQGAEDVATGLEKLGCWIGARTSLGIQVIVLPGRIIANDSLFEPRVTVSRNYPTGHYRVKQEIEAV